MCFLSVWTCIYSNESIQHRSSLLQLPPTFSHTRNTEEEESLWSYIPPANTPNVMQPLLFNAVVGCYNVIRYHVGFDSVDRRHEARCWGGGGASDMTSATSTVFANVTSCSLNGYKFELRDSPSWFLSLPGQHTQKKQRLVRDNDQFHAGDVGLEPANGGGSSAAAVNNCSWSCAAVCIW